jgi:hypothetical protein
MGTRGATTMIFHQFTPTQWNTAQDKARFAEQFIKFVQSGFAKKNFTDRFYSRLSMTFGHIAHNDRGGFWQEFFTTTHDKIRFLKRTLQYACHGDPAWTYSDVERAVQAWLKAEGTLDKYQGRRAAEDEVAERAELARLQKKYTKPAGETE